MKILSLFDGISIAQQAFKELGEVEYYASEIDKNAIQITQKNHPNTIQLGDIKDIDCTGGKLHYGKGKLAETDIYFLCGGSPCQDLSIAKKNREGLDGKRSGLFWEYVRILKELKPNYFVLENVASMSKESKQTITDTLWGIEPVMINAAFVSAQNRKRLFWIGELVDKRHIGHWDSADYIKVEISQPEDKGILLRDVLEGNNENVKACSLRGRYTIEGKRKDIKGAKTQQRLEIGGDKANTITSVTKDSLVFIGGIGKKDWVGDGKYFSRNYPQGQRVYSPEGKTPTLSANGGGLGAKTGLYEIDGDIRKLTPIECERLQCLPDNYTEGISNTQRYKTLGNGFNCAVIKHILENIL